MGRPSRGVRYRHESRTQGHRPPALLTTGGDDQADVELTKLVAPCVVSFSTGTSILSAGSERAARVFWETASQKLEGQFVGGDGPRVRDGETEYFATVGPTSDLDRHADRIAGLGSDPAGLGEIVRGLLIHNWTAEVSGIDSSPDRDGMRTFGASPTIDRIVDLDSAPLDQPRPPEERLIGYCYHFALAHCALLRAKGVPSRTRCGFASYLADGKWTDHWVVEHWDGREWRLNDPQVGFDQLSHDDFRSGVRAWQLCRSGQADPTDHGIGDLWGWDELRGSLVNDLGALNKVEIGDWEWCELLRVEPLDQPHQDVDEHLDRVAALAEPSCPMAELHAAFEHDEAIRPPDDLIRSASPR